MLFLVVFCYLFVFFKITNKQRYLEVLAYNQSYNSITTKATPMDYYLVHDQVDSNETQVKKKYEDKYLSKKADFKQSKLDIKDSYLNGYLTTSYFTVDVHSDEIEAIRIVQGNNPLEIQLGDKIYQNNTIIPYKTYRKYYHTKKA